EMVKQDFPWATFLANSNNLGYSRGNNVGIRVARGERFLLLNPDTLVHSGALKRMVDFSIAHPEVAVVGPKHFSATGEINFECASDYPTTWNVFCDLAFLSRVFRRSRLFNGRML